MSMLVTLVPNVTTYIQGDPPITVSMSGGTDPEYLWESNNGTFANRFVASTTFTPNNATKVTSIVARMVRHLVDGGIANATTTGATSKIVKNAGSTTTWDSYAFYATPITAGNTGFIEAEPTEVNTEKALGFLPSGATFDPNSPTFSVAWHMLANGTAVPRRAGTALTVPVIYKVGDIFRVSLEASRITFLLNGVVIATTPILSVTAFASVAFRTVGGSLNNPSFMSTPTNETFATISVSGLFPVQPNYTYELGIDNNTLSSVAEDGSATFRKKGNAKKTLNLQFNERPYSEYLSLVEFWNAHEKHERFVYQDLVLNQAYIMRFTSGLTVQVIGQDNLTIQATLKEI